jgi:hypothetical protein
LPDGCHDGLQFQPTNLATTFFARLKGMLQQLLMKLDHRFQVIHLAE